MSADLYAANPPARLWRLLAPGPDRHSGMRRSGMPRRRSHAWRALAATASSRCSRPRWASASSGRGIPSGDRYKTLAEPRIMRVGRLLQRCDLDELPQLFSVVVGEVSLVGPRPAISTSWSTTSPATSTGSRWRPGMTGLWQVSRRDGLSAAEMMELDLRYVREASAWLDLQVLVRTGPALLAAAARRT